MRFISKKLCRLLFAVLLTSTVLQTSAATDPVVTKPLLGSENKVILNAESYAKDTKYFTLTQANKDSVKNNSIVNMVGVGIEEQSNFYIRSNFTVKLTLQIISYDKNDVVISTKNKLFTINYDTASGAKYRSFDDTTFLNAYSVRVKILGIDSGTVNWPVSKVIKVENQLTATRDYYFNCNLAIAGLNDSLFVANNELSAYWQLAPLNTNAGITEYDLEWAWVDEGSVDGFKIGSNYMQESIFANNATRVSISGSVYNIPLLYDDTGRIFIRVRPVQLRTDGQRVEGKWSWITNDPSQPNQSTNPLFYTYNGHEDKLNWQASTSFAEEGKRKSVVQYFDGSLRNRQTVTKDNTSNTTVVAESFYDYQGRAVIQVLPAPTLNTAIGYARNFNRGIGEQEYPKTLYDKLANGASVCSSPAKPFNTDFGTANYYSAKNPMLLTDASSKYIPDATAGNPNEAYAFSETRLSPDGRVAAQGGVGITHQIGSNHETKYFYETPAQEELDALFGTDAGIASHYFKNIVQDANGQFSVSYADMHGRTVATALAGETPKNADGTPMLDALSSQNETPFTKQLLDNETNRVIGKSIVSSKPFVVLKDNSTYSFDYSLAAKQLSLLSCTNQPICYDCLYKLKFTISSDCDKQLIYEDSSTNFTLGQYINQCNNGNANQGFVKHFDKILNKGSYTVTKVLTLSTEAQNKYRDVFIANDTCRKFIDFYTQELSILQATSNCNMTCESCKAAIGMDFAGFRAKFVAESGTPEPLSASIVAQLQASFNEAYANCDRMCNNNDGLDLLRNIKQMMLQDVTPPYGQYAKLNDNDQMPPLLNQERSYNIFKEFDLSNRDEVYRFPYSWITPPSLSVKTDYKMPIKYDENNSALLDRVHYYNEFGEAETIDPTLISPEQFVDSFKTAWANQLLPHHPEFAKLRLTETQLKPTYLFEANLDKDTTWAQAVSHNYITNLVNLDPFFNGVAPALYKQRMMYGYYNGGVAPPVNIDINKNPIIHGISNFAIPHTTSPCPNAPMYDDVFTSMWQVALGTIYCRDKADAIDPCSLDYGSLDTKAGCTMNSAYYQPANTFSEGCATDRDWAWKVFKNLYLAERKKLISAYLNTNAPSFSIAYPNNNIPPYQLRFINHANPQSTFENVSIADAGNIGDIINAVGNDINGGLAQAQNLAQAQYDTVCRGYASTWIAQLKSCSQLSALFSNTTTWQNDSTWLVTRLRGVCQRGADAGHFLGSSSVSPANFNSYVVNGITFNDFPKVIQQFLQDKGIAQPTAECYPWLISVPKLYDKQPALANSYVLTKPTACECERISGLRFEWGQSGFAGTFSAYLQHQHGTFISNEQLDAITALCTNNYQCKMLEKPIALPPALQCRGENDPAPKTCISCQEYQVLKADFFALNAQHAPFAHPTNQTEVSYNYSFAAYANNRTGFSKTWNEYVAFDNTCASANPPISCSSLDSTLTAFYLSPQYLQNPLGLACVQAFVNYFNNRYQVLYNYQQWMSLFAQCGNVPNVCKPRITCTSFEALINDFYNQNGVQIFKNGNCQSLFVNYINTRLTSNYTFGQLDAIYKYTCKGNCGLDVCSFPNQFLLTRVYNAFKAANPQPWNLPNCQQAFADYFNNYFGLPYGSAPVYNFDGIKSNFYDPLFALGCVPDISNLCTPPYDCNILEAIRNKFLEANQPISQLPNCQEAFAIFFNEQMGTTYTYAEIAAIYLQICHIQLIICDVKTDCKSIIVFAETHPIQTISESLCHSQFLALFNGAFGTNYLTWNELYSLYKSCGYSLDIVCVGCTFTLVASSESLHAFLNDFKKQYPDPSTQLGNKCQDYFAAMFNEQFKTQHNFEQISEYYLQQAGVNLDICVTQCTKVTAFITTFNTQYATLKLPKAAREDLFAFAYNNAFLQGADNTDAVTMKMTSASKLVAVDEATEVDAKVFTPLVNYPVIQKSLVSCGVTNFNLNTTATISIYDPQVLLSLKQVYYIIHPNGLPDDCEKDFQSWFNSVMKTQYEYNGLLILYNNTCGNNAGYICEKAPDVADEKVSVYVDFMGAGTASIDLPPMLCGLNDPIGTPVLIDDNPCKDLPKIAFHVAFDKYQLYVDSLRNVFDTAYHNKCMAARDLESFTVTYKTSEYHYTLYYFDQVGLLVKTLPPAGVNPNFDATYLANVKAARLSGAVVNNPLNNETLATQYRYNSLNHIVAQKTPDGGISKFWYDALGRVIISQNAKQAVSNKYSYTLYDELGRPKEVGQLTNTMAIIQSIAQNPTALGVWINNKPAEQITRTFYDKTYFDGTGILCPDMLCQKNVRNRVSFTALYATGVSGNITIGDHATATFYSYNIHGSIDSLLQDYNNGIMKTTGNRFKKLVYDFDLISGKVNAVSYQAGKADAFYHRYLYDATNRITDIETSNDKIVWEKDARYNYYKHGALSRTVLGQNQVQGIDYAYTLQGQLKGINSTSVGDGFFDMGQDGKAGSSNSNIARDVYGISLNYLNGDYKPISNAVTPFASISIGNDLFNGNIKSQVVNVPKLGNPIIYSYGYDQLNRLIKMDAYNGLNNVMNTFTAISVNDYKERISFDPSGNIKTYLRNGTGATINLNNYVYTYLAGSNKLVSIANSVNGQTRNYAYDEIGNTTNDGMQGMTNAVWNASGKLQSAINKDGTNIIYTYAADGQRISKTVGNIIECYVKDATGNTMVTYKKDVTINSGHLSTNEFYKYGSSLLATKNYIVDMEVPFVNNGTTFIRGENNYILVDVNGNTRVTIKDTRTQVADPANPLLVLYYVANISSATFSSTYGANAKLYNGGFEAANFNGQRRSLEIGVDAQTAEFWEYNGDVARRANLDPVVKVWESPYAAFGNNPIWLKDLNGADTVKTNNQEMLKTDLKATFPGIGVDFGFDNNGNLTYGIKAEDYQNSKDTKVKDAFSAFVKVLSNESDKVINIIYSNDQIKNEDGILITGVDVNGREQNGIKPTDTGGEFTLTPFDVPSLGKSSFVYVNPAVSTSTYKSVLKDVVTIDDLRNGTTQVQVLQYTILRQYLVMHGIGHTVYQRSNEQSSVIDFDNIFRAANNYPLNTDPSRTHDNR